MYEKFRRLPIILCLLILCIGATILLCVVVDQIEFVKLREPKPLPGGWWLYPAESRLLNLRTFQYVINNDACQDASSLLAVLIVTSHAGDTQARAATRSALPVNELKRLNIRRVFLLAKPSKRQKKYKYIKQQSIERENRRFGDLVQGNFYEAYRNLSYKHVMGLQWALTYCPHAKYIIKLDDDIAVNIYQLLAILSEQLVSNNNAMAGYVLKAMSPARIGRSKWRVTYAEWSAPKFPDFLSGWLYATTPQVVKKILTAVQDQFLWIDDVLVTGIARELAKVTLIELAPHFALHSEFLHCCLQGYGCNFTIAPTSGDWQLLARFLRYTVAKHGNISSVSLPASYQQHKCIIHKQADDLPLRPGHAQLIQAIPL